MTTSAASEASSLLSTPPVSSSIGGGVKGLARQNEDGREQSTPPPPAPPTYRPARQLPLELAQHAQTYFEEGLFIGGLNFLLSISASSHNGYSDRGSDNDSPAVFVAPRAILALAGTIAVHPVFTSRTVARDRWEQAHAALRLLRLSLATVGPVGARLGEALAFRKYDYGKALNGGGGAGNGNDDDDEDYLDDYRGGGGGTQRQLRTPATPPAARTGTGTASMGEHELKMRFARGDSVWARAEDFWQVVGWAFNCACLAEQAGYAERWKWWLPWLEFMADVLEADWELHYCYAAAGGGGGDRTVEESMMWQYIELSSGGYARTRRMMRAIFADGSQKSLNEFGPVFRNELKLPRGRVPAKRTRQVQRVDVDKEVYGDYLFPNSGDEDADEDGGDVDDDDDDDDDNDDDDDDDMNMLTSRQPSRSSSRASRTSGGGGGDDEKSRRKKQKRKQLSWSAHQTRPTSGGGGGGDEKSRRKKQKRKQLSWSAHQTRPTSGGGGGGGTGRLKLGQCGGTGGVGLQLRMRLLQLLSVVADEATQTSSVPSTFVDLDELYDHFVEWMRPLPLDVFQQVVSAGTATSRRFGTAAHTTLCEMIVQWMLESAAPAVRADRFLTRDKLVRQYLPFGAGAADVADQAKLSLCLETLLRRAVDAGLIAAKDGIDDVRRAVDSGAERRAELARTAMAKRAARKRKKKTSNKNKGRPGGDDDDDDDDDNDEEALQEHEAWMWLKESEARMSAVVEMMTRP